MSSAPDPARITYLTDAAHLLRGAAPEISAHLMTERSELLPNQDTSQADLQRQHVCAACGHILILGQGAEMKLERREVPRRGGGPAGKMKAAKAPTAASSGPTKVLCCGHCKSITRIRLPPPAPATRRKVAAKPPLGPHKATATQTPTSTPTPTPTPSEASKPTANASSKKRAKNRKAGLQALLSGQQKQSSQSPLTLGDFMRK